MDNQLTLRERANLQLVALASAGCFEEAEALALQLPQQECQVFHHFGPGFCIREMHIPAGTFVIGHQHLQGLANSFVKGQIKLWQNGVWEELYAPVFFVGKPGRKCAIAITDCIWQNIIATNETDIQAIESLFVVKSENWKAAHAAKELT